MIALVADGADRPGRRQKGTWIKRYSKKHKCIYEISASILIDFWSFIWRGVIRVSSEHSFHQDGVVPNWFPWYSAAILKAAKRLICTLTSSANDLWQNINKGLDLEWCCTVKEVRSAPRRKYTALCTIWPTLCHGVSGFILLVFAFIRNKGTWKDIGYNVEFTIIGFWAQELELLIRMGSAYLDRDLTLITASFEHLSLGFAKTNWKSDNNVLSWESSDLVFLFSSRNRE